MKVAAEVRWVISPGSLRRLFSRVKKRKDVVAASTSTRNVRVRPFLSCEGRKSRRLGGGGERAREGKSGKEGERKVRERERKRERRGGSEVGARQPQHWRKGAFGEAGCGG